MACRRQVLRASHTAGRVPCPASGMTGQPAQAVEIGSAFSADPLQGHEDHPGWPQARIGEQGPGPQEPGSQVVQGEYGCAGCGCRGSQHSRRAQGLAAQYRGLGPAGVESSERGRVMDAAVRPQLQVGIAAPDAVDRTLIVPPVGDGVQVREIQAGKGIQVHQRLGDAHGAAVRAQRRAQGAVAPALAPTGTDHPAAHEVHDGHDVQARRHARG